MFSNVVLTSFYPWAGGFVSDGYLNGHLSVTRGIGDFHLDSLKEKKGEEEPFSGPLTAGLPHGSMLKWTLASQFVHIWPGKLLSCLKCCTVATGDYLFL